MNEQSSAQRTVGRPRSEAKRAAILHAAGVLFMRHGPEGTTMDAVAAEAQVSKQTVYSHFGDKEALFAACIQHKVNSYRLSDLPELAGLPLPDALTQLGERFMNLLMDPEVVCMFRVVIGIGASHPEIGALFYRNGPQRTIEALAGLLQPHLGRGGFHADDCREAAALFIDMLAAHLQRKLLLGVGKAPGKAAQRRQIDRTVERFLRVFSPG